MFDASVAGSQVLFGRLTLGVVFALSGLTKLANVSAFAQSVRGFRVLPDGLVGPFAIGIVVAEIAGAAALLIGTAVQSAAAGILLLLGLFTLALVQSLLRGERVVCRCFGEASARPVGWEAVVRNLLLATLAAFTLAASFASVQEPPAVSDIVAVILLSSGALAILALVSESGALLRLERSGPASGRTDRVNSTSMFNLSRHQA